MITLNGFLDLGEETDQASSQEDLGGVLGEAFVKSLFASADLRIRVTFPAEVVSTTGSLSEDRRTVTWTPDIGEKLDLTTTVRVPSFNFVLYVAAGLGAMLIVAVTLLMIKRRKQSTVASGDSIVDSDRDD